MSALPMDNTLSELLRTEANASEELDATDSSIQVMRDAASLLEIYGRANPQLEDAAVRATRRAEKAEARAQELEAALQPIQKFMQKWLIRKRIGTPYYKMNQESRTPYAIWLTSLTEGSNSDATLSDICQWYDAATAALTKD